MKSGLILCDCNSPEHQIVYLYDKEWDEVYLQIHLKNYRSFFHRLIVGIKYIFGYKSQYGHWDEFIITKDNKDKFIEMVSKLNE